MTVNWNLLYLVPFLASVYSIQNSFLKVTSEPICSHPYSCIPTNQCAERHSIRGTEEVVFRCEGKKNVCCPPVRNNATNNGVQIQHNAPNNGAQNQHNAANNGVQNQHNAASNGVQIQHNAHNNGVQTQHNATQQSDIAGNNKQPPQNNRQSNSGKPSEVPTINVNKTPSSIQPQGVPESRRPEYHQAPEYGQPYAPQYGRPQEPHLLSQTLRPQTSQQSTGPQNSILSHRNFKFLPDESNCGVNNFADRITEGEEVSLGEYPWMALTGLRDKYGNYRWNCGGTLINGWYVLTAAHCLVVDNRTIEYVRLGEHNLRTEVDCNRDICLDPPEDIAIAEVIPHEKWNTTTIKNDIALLRLSKNALQLGKTNIHPICLPVDKEKINITSSTKYVVTGWGKTDWNEDEGSDVLRKASISGVNREECNICKDKKKQQYCPIANTQLCVQGWKSVDVCKGDSGGPLMVYRLNVYQMGITSFKGSEQCGAENIPSIFTRVESYLPWILDNIRA